MTILIEWPNGSDRNIAGQVEQAIHDAIGERPNEHWSASIEVIGRFYKVTVKGPVQTRSERFFGERSKLPQKVAEWLALYPLR